MDWDGVDDPAGAASTSRSTTWSAARWTGTRHGSWTPCSPGSRGTRRPRLRPPDAAPLPLVPPPPAGGTRTVRGSPASTSTPGGKTLARRPGLAAAPAADGLRRPDAGTHARPARGDRALRRRPRRARRGSRCLVPAGRAPPRRDRREPRGHRLRPPPHEGSRAGGGPGRRPARANDRRAPDGGRPARDDAPGGRRRPVDARAELPRDPRGPRLPAGRGGPVGRPFASVLAQRGATLRARRRSSAPAGWSELYRAGPNAGLLGALRASSSSATARGRAQRSSGPTSSRRTTPRTGALRRT